MLCDGLVGIASIPNFCMNANRKIIFPKLSSNEKVLSLEFDKMSRIFFALATFNNNEKVGSL